MADSTLPRREDVLQHGEITRRDVRSGHSTYLLKSYPLSSLRAKVCRVSLELLSRACKGHMTRSIDFTGISDSRRVCLARRTVSITSWENRQLRHEHLQGLDFLI